MAVGLPGWRSVSWERLSGGERSRAEARSYEAIISKAPNSTLQIRHIMRHVAAQFAGEQAGLQLRQQADGYGLF